MPPMILSIVLDPKIVRVIAGARGEDSSQNVSESYRKNQIFSNGGLYPLKFTQGGAQNDAEVRIRVILIGF